MLKKTVNQWQALGVRANDNSNLPNSNMKAALLLPMSYNEPVFLVYRNFNAMLRWNHSILYALSVGHLSNHLVGAKPLSASPIIESLLSNNDVSFIQNKLTKLGFNIGNIDGISGIKTRNTVRDYQHAQGLPVDGYVGYQLFQQLQ